MKPCARSSARLPDALGDSLGAESTLSTYCRNSWRRSAPSAASTYCSACARAKSTGRRDCRIALERAQHPLLARDDVERGQLAQPGRRRLGRHQRIGGSSRARRQEREHGVASAPKHRRDGARAPCVATATHAPSTAMQKFDTFVASSFSAPRARARQIKCGIAITRRIAPASCAFSREVASCQSTCALCRRPSRAALRVVHSRRSRRARVGMRHARDAVPSNPVGQGISKLDATRSELQKIDVKQGTGAEAIPGKHGCSPLHRLAVRHFGARSHGAKFDSSLDRSVPFGFVLGAGRVIKGWDEGVAGMKVGGQRTLVIPPRLATASAAPAA